MDKLEKTRQSEIPNMSEERLLHQLCKAGFTVEILEGMDRAARLDKYAELVLAGKEPVAGKSAATAALVGYDVELERQCRDFQMKQWEAEKYDQDEQRKIEMARIENERAHIEAEKFEREEHRKVEWACIEAVNAEREVERTQREMQRQFEIERLAAEKAEREEASAVEVAFRETQLELQQRQLKLLEDKGNSDISKKDTRVAQLKRYGDALRNSVTKLGVEPVEIIKFFENIER